MKKKTLVSLLFCFAVSAASAQTKAHKGRTAQQKNAPAAKAKSGKSDSTVVLVNTNSYPAFATKPDVKFRIADPTINNLNRRAAGAPVPKNSSGIIGVSKHGNGFANGHILLRTTTATSPGTGYGSGAVGTGTSIQGAGTSEVTLGANGKSPYAGPSLWGDKQPFFSVKGSDTTRRQ